MVSYDLLMIVIAIGSALTVFQLIYSVLTWRTNEASDSKAFAVMQNLYKKAVAKPLGAVFRPLKVRR
jgi:hypothetical protein